MKKRTVMTGLCLTLLMLAGVLQAETPASPDNDAAQRARFYVGTGATEAGQGIYVFEMDLKSGEPTEPRLAAEARRPNFLTIHPNHSRLYAVMEGAAEGAAAAYQIDAQTGALTLLGDLHGTGGNGPCHITLDKTGRVAIVSNYPSGSVCSLLLNEDGSIHSRPSLHQHEGSGPNKNRQTRPHCHSATVSDDNRFVVVADLGIDKLMVYQLNAEAGTITPHDPAFVSTPAGGGPRHFAFHPHRDVAYANNELDSSITSFEYDSTNGILKTISTLSTLPADWEGQNTNAECLVHPTGKFVYVSNRGHDSIALFEVNPDGSLTARGQTPCGGKTPRNFGFDPTGSYMLVTNEASDLVSIFTIDQESGQLTATGKTLSIPKPMCVRGFAIQ